MLDAYLIFCLMYIKVDKLSVKVGQFMHIVFVVVVFQFMLESVIHQASFVA